MSADPKVAFDKAVKRIQREADDAQRPGCPKCLRGVPGVMSDPMFHCDECHGTGIPDSKARRRVEAHDAIQILGEHIYNPVTGEIVRGDDPRHPMWQWFAVTETQEGLMLDRDKLIPRRAVRPGNPTRMVRMISICALNFVPVSALPANHPFWCGNPKPIW